MTRWRTMIWPITAGLKPSEFVLTMGISSGKVILINPFSPIGWILCPCQCDKSIKTEWVSRVFFHFCFIFYVDSCMQNSGDPDHTPHSTTSDLGLHCLPTGVTTYVIAGISEQFDNPPCFNYKVSFSTCKAITIHLPKNKNVSVVPDDTSKRNIWGLTPEMRTIL